MPTLSVKKDYLMKRLGHVYTDEEFDELCFQYGLELDEITSEKEMAMKEKGATGQESDDVVYKIDLPANRYDLLSAEGLALALKLFIGKLGSLEFKVEKPPTDNSYTFNIDSYADSVRPVLVAAVVKDVNMADKELYNSLIELQDKLHSGIGRKRSIVSIGTHDLDTIKGPFLYTAMEPQKIKFRPLNQDKQMTGQEMMEFYAESYLKPYLSIIKDEPRYPILMDSNNTVLSMPPIINGDRSKINSKTKNILIEVTAMDRGKAIIALETIVTMLLASKHLDDVKQNCYTAQGCLVKVSPKLEVVTPEFHPRFFKVSLDEINRRIGTQLSKTELPSLLKKMGVRHRADKDGDVFEAPPTRHDIIGMCDIVEEVAIAYGYNNIKPTLPRGVTIAAQDPLNHLADELRHEISRCGYTEALNFALCSVDEVGKLLRKAEPKNLVRIQNPKTVEFQVVRTSLLPGFLKTLNSNKQMPLPIKLFEVGDIVYEDESKDVGARNERYLGAIYYGQTSGFEIIHGLLDQIMKAMKIPYIGDKPNRDSLDAGYYIEASNDESYLKGRCADVILNREKIGILGTLHPEILTNFELNHPSSVLEINIEKLLLKK